MMDLKTFKIKILYFEKLRTNPLSFYHFQQQKQAGSQSSSRKKDKSH